MRAAARVGAIAMIVLALSFGVVAISNALVQVTPDAVLRLGSVVFYAVWSAIAAIYAAAWPSQAAAPYLPITLSRRDAIIAAIAAVLALAMYAPMLFRVVRDGATPPRLDFFGGAVAAPIVEEWLFRGLVWNLLARAVDSERAAILVNLTAGSLIFGLFHLSFEGLNWLALANVFPHALFGALVGIVRWRTRSLLPGTLVHLVGNFTARLAMA